jgi:hypothetical protein
MAFLSRQSKLATVFILSAFAAAETAGAFPIPAQKTPVQFETAKEQIQLVRRGRGKAGNRGRLGKYRKARAQARLIRRLKMREARRYRMAAKRSKSRRVRVNVVAANEMAAAVIFGSAMWNTRATKPPADVPQTRKGLEFDAASKDIENYPDALRRSQGIHRRESVDCNRAASIVTGYGFSDLVPRTCEGKELVFEGVRDTQLYVVKVSPIDGELLHVSKFR